MDTILPPVTLIMIDWIFLALFFYWFDTFRALPLSEKQNSVEALFYFSGEIVLTTNRISSDGLAFNLGQLFDFHILSRIMTLQYGPKSSEDCFR